MAKKTVSKKKPTAKPKKSVVAKKKTTAKTAPPTVHRFAHPFYATTAAGAKTPTPADSTQITNYSADKLLPIPTPIRTPPTMTLAEIIGNDGSSGVSTHGELVFHACGDSGNPATDMQEVIATAMTADYDTAHPEKSPAFFLHLGDVIYYDNTDSGYHEQFYTPYKSYPGKIIAIAGNHDGEMFKYDGSPTGQKITLGAFQENFCQPQPGVPNAAGTIYRQMISQPGVYWQLNSPLVDIVGLYSNIGETPGFISGTQIGDAQKNWLVQTLKLIASNRTSGTRKALILAVHHPPYSNGGHEPSVAMLKDLDDACTQAGLMPDVVLAAHAHNYQRYVRHHTFGGKNLEIPYLVVGTAGRGIQSLVKATGQTQGEVTYGKSLAGYGFLRVRVDAVHQGSESAKSITMEFTQVQANHDQSPNATPFDSITLDLATAVVTEN